MSPVFGQTEDIQREIDRTLWYLRVVDAIERATGMPAGAALLTLLALVLALGCVIWLWKSRGKRGE